MYIVPKNEIHPKSWDDVLGNIDNFLFIINPREFKQTQYFLDHPQIAEQKVDDESEETCFQSAAVLALIMLYHNLNFAIMMCLNNIGVQYNTGRWTNEKAWSMCSVLLTADYFVKGIWN